MDGAGADHSLWCLGETVGGALPWMWGVRIKCKTANCIRLVLTEAFSNSWAELRTFLLRPKVRTSLWRTGGESASLMSSVLLLLLLLLCFWQTSCHINPLLLLHLHQLLPIIHIKVSTYPSVLERNPRKRTYVNDGWRLMMSSVWDFSSFYQHSLLGIYFHSKDTT